MPIPGQILLVDRDPALQRLLSAIVLRNHLHPVVAPDGTTALSWLMAEEFDVIVLDLMLGAPSGLDVLRHLAETAPRVLERTIIMTARPEMYANCSETAAAWSVVRKPLDLEEIEAALLECYAERLRDATRKPPHRAAKSLPHLHRVAN
jgi:DNA-binding response OmpR family regulator